MIAVVLVAVLGIGLYFLITSQINATKERTFSEFRDLIEVKEGEVQTDNSEPPIKMIYILVHDLWLYHYEHEFAVFILDAWPKLL